MENEIITQNSSIMTENPNITENVHSIDVVNYDVFIQGKIPAIVYLFFISFIGVIGNIHAIVVYYLCYKPSNHRTLIIALAIVDLAASSLSAPFEAFELRYEYTFTSIPVCKSFRFLNYVTGTASGFLLGVIAVERHRKVCVPMGCQISEKAAKIACGVTVLVAAIISIPSFIVYGPTLMKVTEMPELDMYGYDCTVLTRYEKSWLFKGFVTLLLLLITVVFIVCFVIYVMVGKVIYRQVKFRKLSQLNSKKIVDDIRKNQSNDTLDSNLTQDDESSGIESSNIRLHITTSGHRSHGNGQQHHGNRETKITKQKKSFNRSKKITLMFLVATAISYLSYVPNILLVGMKAVDRQSSRRAEMSLGALYLILVRSYFISNITNPIVYCFVDDRFRRECINLYRKLMSRCFRDRKYTI